MSQRLFTYSYSYWDRDTQTSHRGRFQAVDEADALAQLHKLHPRSVDRRPYVHLSPNINEVAGLLRELPPSVQFAIACFDGSGDSGDIYSTVLAEGEEGETYCDEESWAEWDGDLSISPVQVKRVTDAMEAYAYEVLGEHYGGWGNDDGARGEVHVHRSGRAYIHYNARFTSSEYALTDIEDGDEPEEDAEVEETAAGES